MNAIPFISIFLGVLFAAFAHGRNRTVSPQESNMSPVTSGNGTSNDTLSENQNKTRPGCFPAFARLTSSPKCYRYYNHSTGLCNTSIPADALIYVNIREQRMREYKLKSVRVKPEVFKNTLPDPTALLRQSCFQVIQDMYCHFYFPRCDMTSSTPKPQQICREACEMLNFMCKSKWIKLMQNYPGVSWYAQDEIGEKMREHESFDDRRYILMKCEGLPLMKGPNIPECYIPKKLLYYKTSSENSNGFPDDCYYGNGFAYRGNVSRTISGYSCQSWSDQCPHRHFRTPDRYKELAGAGNACRNPGHQAPLGPWCYTINPLVRWEYCNVTKCEQAQLKNLSQKPIKIQLRNIVPSKTTIQPQAPIKVNNKTQPRIKVLKSISKN